MFVVVLDCEAPEPVAYEPSAVIEGAWLLLDLDHFRSIFFAMNGLLAIDDGQVFRTINLQQTCIELCWLTMHHLLDVVLRHLRDVRHAVFGQVTAVLKDLANLNFFTHVLFTIL